MAAWNQNPYNGYNGVAYNPTPSFIPQNYNPMPQAQAGYMNAPVQPQQGLQGQGAQPMVLLGRMVTSKEEALGVPVDFSGNPMYFPTGQGVIYSKKFNMQTGSSDFDVYVKVNPQNQEQQNVQSVQEQSVPSFASAKDVKELQDKIASLEQEIEELRKPVQVPAESTSSTKGGKK